MTYPRVLNIHAFKFAPTPESAVNIMRPGKWGNKFVIGRDGNRDQVCDRYEKWFETQPQLIACLPEIRGRDLLCCCEPLRCHGHFLRWRANGGDRPKPYASLFG